MDVLLIEKRIYITSRALVEFESREEIRPIAPYLPNDGAKLIQYHNSAHTFLSDFALTGCFLVFVVVESSIIHSLICKIV